MNTQKHTAGPFQVVKTGNRQEIANEHGDVLAECFGDDEDPMCWPISANANLFASAPDLLNALQIAKATIERLTVKHGPFSSTQGTLDVIGSAIQRAGGAS